jgi:choice-of-anchor A domain-containing protein
MISHLLPRLAWSTPRHTVALIALSVITSVSSAQSANKLNLDLGLATDYAGFFFGNVSNLQDVEGRLAVGGDFSAQGLSIGGRLPAPPAKPLPSLVVGGSIKRFDSGSIWHGSQRNHYGEYTGTKGSTVPPYLDLRKNNFTQIDFAAEQLYLTSLSEQLRDTPNTGNTLLQWGAVLTLTGSNQAIEVFTLTADQVTSGKSLELKNIKNNAWVVLNIKSDKNRKVAFGLAHHNLQNQRDRVLFNFYDADVIHFTGVQMWGSVLAPLACICNSNGHIEGNVIARHWDSYMEIGYNPLKKNQ